MRKVGSYLLASLGVVLILFGVLGFIETGYFILTSEPSAYDIGFIVGRCTVLIIVITLGYRAFKKSKSFSSEIAASE
jgi:hypothetical protein